MKSKLKLKNRILSLVLTLAMVVGLMPMTAYAAAKTSVTIADLTYTLTVKSATDKNGNDILSSIEIDLDEKKVGRTGNTVKINSIILYGFGTGFSCEFTDTDCTQGLSVDREFVLGNNSTGYQKAVVTISRSAASHTGGTCTSPTCTRCGMTYDAPHNYNTWKNNGTYHWQECSYDASHTTGYGTCSGGTATCHDLATCSTCNLTYGQVDPDNHVWTKWEHGDSVHSVKHFRTCQYCVDVEQREYCYPQSNCTYKAQCETCKTYLALDLDAHSWGSWESNGDGTHTRICTINSSHTETQSCSGDSSSTCTIEGTCTTCGKQYFNLQAHKLSYTATDCTVTETCDSGCGHTATAALAASDQAYTGSPITTGASVTYSEGWAGDKPQPADGDYSNNTEPGTATVTATVAGYRLTTTFQINAADISGSAVTLTPESGVYNGTAYKPSVSVTYCDIALAENTDYTLSWDQTGFTNADDYTVTVTGKGNFKGTKTAVFKINPADIAEAEITLDQNTFIYDGTEQKPTVTVTWNGVTLTENTDYTVSYENNVNVSRAADLGTVYVVGINNFTGRNEEVFEITRRELTITAEAKEAIVNTELPTYTYKADGLVGGDTLTTEPTLVCNADITVIGTYDITASGADAGSNYSIKYVPAKLTVLTDKAVDAAAGYTEALKDYAPDTVTSADKAALDEMLSEINTFLADETTTDNGKKALEEVKVPLEALLKEINDAAEATNTENISKVEDVTKKNVTPEDKTDLENAKADYEKALETHGSNMTEAEKKAVEDEIKRIDSALKVLSNVEAVEALIGKLPETITKKDKDAVDAADDAYKALSKYEKSLVDKDAKKTLTDAKSDLAKLYKSSSTVPATGDNGELWLWTALLIASSGAAITLIVADRKRRSAAKK